MSLSDSWFANYEALRAHVARTGHFPDKHTALCNWVKYQRKRIRCGTMPGDQRVLFEQLAASRSFEHTGGRCKRVEPTPSLF